MIKVAFVIYRAWAYRIYEQIADFHRKYPEFSVAVVITTPENEFHADPLLDTKIHIVRGNDQSKIHSLLAHYQIDIAFFYGWSWIVREPILSEFVCLCLHPSPLPKYRGGSPIQHQIIDGKTDSAVTVFKMGSGIDDGDIYRQLPISLEGTLDDIFERIIAAGVAITKTCLRDYAQRSIQFTPQQSLGQYPVMKRRTQADSELTIEQIVRMPYLKLYNTVRSLTDPYPNACIRFPQGVIYLTSVEYNSHIPPEGVSLTDAASLSTRGTGFYLKVLDGYAKIVRYRIA